MLKLRIDPVEETLELKRCEPIPVSQNRPLKQVCVPVSYSLCEEGLP